MNPFKRVFNYEGDQDYGSHWRAAKARHSDPNHAACPGEVAVLTWEAPDFSVKAFTVTYQGTDTGEESSIRTIYIDPASFWVHGGGINIWGDPNAGKDPLKRDDIPQIGEIIAWRCWEYVPRVGLLQSVTRADIWIPGEPMKGEPSDYGWNGVNAYNSASKAMTEYGIDENDIMITGSVLLWGEVVIHEDGYRAEYALPLTLDHICPDTKRANKWLERLREKYERRDLLELLTRQA